MQTVTTKKRKTDTSKIYSLPLVDLLFLAQASHRKHFDPHEVQLSTLVSIKTGGCPEDCSYCPQSAHYQTSVESEKLMPVERVIDRALTAKSQGATRFCMGAAWRQVKDGDDFDQVLAMVRSVSRLGLETCCTLGMLSPDQARQLKEAGLHAYNHNIDTSAEHYGKVITTRSYADRLATIEAVRSAGITVCTGGILGLGECDEDRIRFLETLSQLDPQPESVTVNTLVRVKGTPMADQAPIDPLTVVRVIAAARILIPKALIRLSAGRLEMSETTQFLCFLAGANSIFMGEKLLTTPNPGADQDHALLAKLGLRAMPA